jgi:hypothetical protein
MLTTCSEIWLIQLVYVEHSTDEQKEYPLPE